MVSDDLSGWAATFCLRQDAQIEVLKTRIFASSCGKMDIFSSAKRQT